MEIVTPGSPEYDKDRQISNARFDYRPSYICYCSNAADVGEALLLAKNKKLGIRIRSGGHQHEGMCSGTGVVMIDVSRINHIRIATDGKRILVGPGARLRDVYDKVLKKGRIFPGGACGDVCVGGLVEGGGWGLYSRRLGLTCDQLLGVRLVKADGTPIYVSRLDTGKLLWAVSGGGGGNFGVATEFLFRLTAHDAPITSFSVSWSDATLQGPVIDEWRGRFPGADDKRITSFCRASAIDSESQDAPVVVAGNFLGDEQPCLEAIRKLLPTTIARGTISLGYVRPPSPARGVLLSGHHPDYQPGPPPAALRALGVSATAARADLTQTCAGTPYPHKVSSCFPRAGFGKTAVEALVKYLATSKARPEAGARRYLSLHSLGGNLTSPNKFSCFAFRDKPFLLQYQAWWADKNDKPLGDRCQLWVKNFREAMKGYTEGSFINFPDKDLVPNPDTPDGREKLLAYYYAGNLAQLVGVKQQYDPLNAFDFEMGIPTRLR